MRDARLYLLTSVFAACALAACSTPYGGKETDDGAGDDDGGGSGGGDGGGTYEGIDDLTSDLDDDTSNCEGYTDEEGDFYPVPGAKTYFVGTYADNGDGTWSGYEQWVLFANERWQEVGEDDCTVTWRAVATEREDAGACSVCNLGLDVALTIDRSNTDCPDGLVEGEENQTTSYGVFRSGSEAVWFFAGSGTEFGAGDASSSVIEFVTEPDCKYF